MYRLTILSLWCNPLITLLDTPLNSSPCSWVPLTYLESLLSVWCDPCPPWSQVACKLTSPSPNPPHSLFPPPTVPQSNYAPLYDDITTPTSFSPAQVLLMEKTVGQKSGVTVPLSKSITIFILSRLSFWFWQCADHSSRKTTCEHSWALADCSVNPLAD